MKTKNLLMIGAGAVVLYFVWQKFGNNSSGSSNGEEKANASGKKCRCLINGNEIWVDCKKKWCSGCCEAIETFFDH